MHVRQCGKGCSPFPRFPDLSAQWSLQEGRQISTNDSFFSQLVTGIISAWEQKTRCKWVRGGLLPLALLAQPDWLHTAMALT